MTGYDYLALDTGYEGSCPCSTFEVDGTRLQAHCWRVCEQCEFSGLHYEGDRTVANRVLSALRAMGWSDWSLVEGLR